MRRSAFQQSAKSYISKDGHGMWHGIGNRYSRLHQQAPIEALGCGIVVHFNVRRLAPSPDNAQFLALVFSLYHSAHNSHKIGDVSPSPRAVQKNLVEAARAYRQHIV